MTVLLSEKEKRWLDTEGLLLLEAHCPAALLEALRQRIAELFVELGEQAGAEFKQEPETDRLANLMDYGELFQQVIAEPKVLACVAHVLGPEFKLGSLNARSARPLSGWVQPLHCDMGALPDARGNAVCNVIWLLDDFTAENGATRYVPGSHHCGQLPQTVLADPSASQPDEMLLTAAAGTVAVMNAHLWHGGTANRSEQARLALHSFYCRRDLPQQQYQKRLLRPQVQAQLSPQLRWLLALDDPLNDELSARDSGRSGFLR
jgi:hypothetical protein